MKNRFLALFLVVVITSLLLFSWYQKSLSPFDKDNQAPVNFVISQGQSVKEIANELKKANLIRSQLAFFIYVRLSGLAKKIQAGNYRLNQAMSIPIIADELTHGKTDEWVTIIEGLRVEEIALILSQKLAIPQSEFLKFAQEGYMFPDTYLIPQSATAEEIVGMFLNNFRQKVTDEIIQKGKEKELTLDEIITLASLLEREVKHDAERPIVAGILLKRLKNDWPLQVDATVQYALGYQAKEKTWWKKNLTEEDLKINSPFNTYKYKGLPPKPIASPGLISIKAVVEPEETNYWYYLSDKNGIMHFAETYEEHLNNINRYLR